MATSAAEPTPPEILEAILCKAQIRALVESLAQMRLVSFLRADGNFLGHTRLNCGICRGYLEKYQVLAL